MSTSRGLALLTVLWFLLLAASVLVIAENRTNQMTSLLWQVRQQPYITARTQALRLFLPALLSGQALPPGAPAWAVRTAPRFARAGVWGRGVVAVPFSHRSIVVHIQDTGGLLAPGWQPALLPLLADALARHPESPPALLAQLQSLYLDSDSRAGARLTAPVAWRFADLTTRHPVYGGRIDVNSVPASVLRVLGLSTSRLRAFISRRRRRTRPYAPDDLARLARTLGLAGRHYFGTGRSGIYRVHLYLARRHGGRREIARYTLRTPLAVSGVPLRRPEGQ